MCDPGKALYRSVVDKAANGEPSCSRAVLAMRLPLRSSSAVTASLLLVSLMAASGAPIAGTVAGADKGVGNGVAEGDGEAEAGARTALGRQVRWAPLPASLCHWVAARVLRSGAAPGCSLPGARLAPSRPLAVLRATRCSRHQPALRALPCPSLP